MRILIPTDFNSKSEECLLGILDLFEDNTNVILFHSVEANSAGSTRVKDISHLLYEDALNNMDSLLSKIRSIHCDRLKVDSRVLTGFFDSDLEITMRTMKPELLILISKPRKGIDKLMDKRKTLGLIGEVKQPIFIVPAEVKIRKLRKIGLALDSKEPINEQTLNHLSSFVKYFKAELKAFHIQNNVDENQDYYSTISNDLVNEVEVVLNEDVGAGIVDWMDRNNADALALITHDKNFFEKLFKRSMTRKLTKENSTPILLLTR